RLPPYPERVVEGRRAPRRAARAQRVPANHRSAAPRLRLHPLLIPIPPRPGVQVMNHQRTMITRTKQLIVAGAVAAIGLVLLTFVRPDSTDARGGEPAIATVEPSKADAAPQQAAVAWREDFSAALVEAAEKNRPALLRFTAAWCTP